VAVGSSRLRVVADIGIQLVVVGMHTLRVVWVQRLLLGVLGSRLLEVVGPGIVRVCSRVQLPEV
jgi:hypothetical protein